MTREEIIRPENKVYARPELLTDNVTHYCPGCSHGVVHKIIAELLDEMGVADKAIGIAPVGCAVFAYKCVDLSLFHLQVYIVKCFYTGECFGYIFHFQ